VPGIVADPDWASSDDEEDHALARSIRKSASNAQQATKKKTTTRAVQHYSPNSIRHAVLYLGHLPKHMEEAELADFLKQFGGIVNLKVVRSTRTGRSRGYAFVQMKSPDVAAIVADTLSGYIVMGQKRLVCHLVPADKVHAGLFARTIAMSKVGSRQVPPQTKSLGKLKLITCRLVQRERKKREALKAMGIDYNFPGYEESNAKMEKRDSMLSQSEADELSKKDKKKKRKDSMASAESSQQSGTGGSESKEKKKRKEAITSAQSTASDISRPEKQKKRKEAISSMDSGAMPHASSNRAKKPQEANNAPLTKEGSGSNTDNKMRKVSASSVEPRSVIPIATKVTSNRSQKKESSKKNKKRIG
jgi:nucleolar protein 15